MLASSLFIVFTSAKLQPVPLIGGPSFLPLHVQVLLEDEISESVPHLVDFIPSDASDPKTLASLLSLRFVPGTYRFRPFPVRKPFFSPSLEYKFSAPLTHDDIDNFISTCPPNLHLTENNCWSFAFNFKAWSTNL